MSAPVRRARWRAEIREAPHVGDALVWAVPTILGGRLDATLSEVAEAEIDIDATAAPRIVPRMHELHLWRGDEPMFAGPILGLGAVGRRGTIVAADRMWWPTHRERHRSATGDASTVVAALVADADSQGPIGLRVMTQPSGWIAAASARIIGADIEATGARWAARWDVLQVGAGPMAGPVDTIPLDAWESPPLVLLAAGAWHTDILATDGDRRIAAPGVWGRTATTAAGDRPEPRIDATWSGSGATGDVGPRITIAGSAGADAAAPAISLRSGVRLDWSAFRPGAHIVAATGAQGGMLTGDPTTLCEVRSLSVVISEDMESAVTPTLSGVS